MLLSSKGGKQIGKRLEFKSVGCWLMYSAIDQIILTYLIHSNISMKPVDIARS